MNGSTHNPLQRKLLIVLAFVAGAFVVHALALGNPFLIDDHSAIEQHPDVQDVSGVFRLWTHHYWEGSPSLDDQLYRPITVFSFWLSQRLTPDSPTGFRVLNLLLLAGIALSVMSWLKRYTGPLPALIAGVLFLVHPANTEAVNHLVGRADLLAVLGIVGFLAVQAGAQQHGWTWPRIAGAALLALIALGSKESGLALVPCAIAQWWVGTNRVKLNHAALAPSPSEGEGWGEGRPSDSQEHGTHTTAPDPPPNPLPPSREGEPETAMHFVKNKCQTARGVCPKRALFLALFLPAAAYLAARLAVVGLPAGYPPATDDLTGNPLRGMGFFERLPEVFAVAWWYLEQAVKPDTTYNHTPSPNMIGPWRLASIVGSVVCVMLTASVIGGLRRRNPWVIPGVLFLIHMLIVGHLLTVTGAYTANRLTIATNAAVAMVAGYFLFLLLTILPRHRKLVVIGAIVFALSFAFQTARANRAWSSELARMHADVQADPEDPIALYWLGQAQLPYDTDAAVSHLRRAHALAPQSNQAASALADAQLATGDDRAAWKLYDQLLARNAPLTDQQRAYAAMAAFNTERYGRARSLLRRLPTELAGPIEQALQAVSEDRPPND